MCGPTGLVHDGVALKHLLEPIRGFLGLVLALVVLGEGEWWYFGPALLSLVRLPFLGLPILHRRGMAID